MNFFRGLLLKTSDSGDTLGDSFFLLVEVLYKEMGEAL